MYKDFEKSVDKQIQTPSTQPLAWDPRRAHKLDIIACPEEQTVNEKEESDEAEPNPIEVDRQHYSDEHTETFDGNNDAVGAEDISDVEVGGSSSEMAGDDVEFQEMLGAVNVVELERCLVLENIDDNDMNIDVENNAVWDTEEEYSSTEDESDVNDADEEDEEWNDVEELRNWAIQSNIPQTQLDRLLLILRRRLLPALPKSSKTFLKTATAQYHIEVMKDDSGASVGEFVYFGIAEHLKKTINRALHRENVLHLQINIDGLPLYKSSSRQFWPILCKVQLQPDVYEPFPIAVYSGIQKPNDLNEYLGRLIEESNGLMETGIDIDGEKFEVRIASFICDRPARSFVKCIKGHGGYYACERCTVKGERHANRTIYCSTDAGERTDESFRNVDNPEHHTGISPLELIRPYINMIFLFILDFMHLCCLGIMKKLLIDCWLQGNLNFRSKSLLSQRLIYLQSQIPTEFQRTTRSVFDVAKWKATEFRFFLLYGGPVVLKKILPDKLFKHFLLFSVSCRILCSPKLAVKYHANAKVYLKSFVQTSRYLYGKVSQVMNMHSLIHLADDVKNMGCPLSEITAFPFENTLGKMKKMLRSGRRPLAQLCRRLHESFFAGTKKVTAPPPVTIIRKLEQTPTGHIPIKILRYKEATIAVKSPNNTVELENGKLLKIDGMYIPPNCGINNIEVEGYFLKKKKPMFAYPCNSKILNMWEVETAEESRHRCPLQHVALKMVTLSIPSDELQRDKIYAMPLLHL